jgi:starch phosphorylase
MRESMARLTPAYSTNRAVREYTERYYLPAAESYRSRRANQGVLYQQIVNWRHSLEQKWAGVHFGESKETTHEGRQLFEVEVHLNDLDPTAVSVELYANGVNGGTPVREEMRICQPLKGKLGGFLYSATVYGNRPSSDYTARVVPHFEGVEVPLEEARIIWQR